MFFICLKMRLFLFASMELLAWAEVKAWFLLRLKINFHYLMDSSVSGFSSFLSVWFGPAAPFFSQYFSLHFLWRGQISEVTLGYEKHLPEKERLNLHWAWVMLKFYSYSYHFWLFVDPPLCIETMLFIILNKSLEGQR